MRRRTPIALVAILIIAAFFRFYGRDFDQDTHQHPDERYIVEQTISVGWPQSFSQFLDVQHSPLNLRSADGGHPDGRHYPYGSLPVYITKAAGWLADTYLKPTDAQPKGFWLGYEGLTKMGR